ncbi:hypothetical protein AB0L33_06600 [Streptomyces sp. NPDC052299]|uniref:hypothetical protein n=1 Tax=Streptomyces sp. NPDC052299 TaxID=3155054 RepID=UPI003437A1C9
MRRRVVRGLAVGWVVLAGAGWAAAQWLGEPAATSGPAPVTPPSSAAEPGPQPESDCAQAMRATPRATALRTTPKGTGSGEGRSRLFTCDYAVGER